MWAPRGHDTTLGAWARPARPEPDRSPTSAIHHYAGEFAFGGSSAIALDPASWDAVGGGLNDVCLALARSLRASAMWPAAVRIFDLAAAPASSPLAGSPRSGPARSGAARTCAGWFRTPTRRRVGACLKIVVVAQLQLHCATGLAAAEQGTDLKPVSIGFVRYAYGTWTAKIADGSFEKSTGRTLRWVPFDTDSAVAAAMANGRVDIGLMGTSVAAASLARGLELRGFFVIGGASDTEGLVLKGDRPFRASEAKSFSNLVIAAPFGSTPHFRLLQSLKRWGIALSGVRLVNLQLPQIADAWSRQEIDAAVVCEPLLGQLKTDGRLVPLAGSGGQDGLLVFAAGVDFVASHLVFLARFVDVIARADAAFASMQGPLTEDRDEVRSIAFLTGYSTAAVIAAIARYRPPRLEDQASAEWLGGGAKSGLAAELQSDAEIWRWAGRLERTDRDFSAAITPAPVEQALKYRE